MRLPESNLTTITKPFQIVKCHVIHHVVEVYVANITIAFLI